MSGLLVRFYWNYLIDKSLNLSTSGINLVPFGRRKKNYHKFHSYSCFQDSCGNAFSVFKSNKLTLRSTITSGEFLKKEFCHLSWYIIHLKYSENYRCEQRTLDWMQGLLCIFKLVYIPFMNQNTVTKQGSTENRPPWTRWCMKSSV